jgi:hypothetical protein
MQISRQHVIGILQTAGLQELAAEARRALPDPVEYDQAADFLAEHGITRDELTSRMGASP